MGTVVDYPSDGKTNRELRIDIDDARREVARLRIAYIVLYCQYLELHEVYMMELWKDNN